MTRAEVVNPQLVAGGSGDRRRGTRSGQILAGSYHLLEIIGSGGMAEVYAAEHTRLGRKFAVKILRADNAPKALSRFRREARALARIDSEFVIGVVDSGETDDGTPYLVMELLQGEDLRSLLEREGRLPIPRAVKLVWEACQGIAAVHRASLVHRDLKPENLFVARRATGEDWCKVLDFGIAKTEVSGSTAEGSLIGTVRYMAPEQLRDGASAGPKVDVYALGAVLYECLSGTSPHTGTTVQELMFKIMNEAAPPLGRKLRGVPNALAATVARALAKSTAERFADVEQFAEALEPFSRVGVHLEPIVGGETADVENFLAPANAAARPSRMPILVAAVGAAVFGFSARNLVELKPASAIANSSTSVVAAAAPKFAPLTPAVVSATPSPPGEPATALVATAPSPPTTSSAANLRHAAAVPRASVTAPHARFDIENPYAR